MRGGGKGDRNRQPVVRWVARERWSVEKEEEEVEEVEEEEVEGRR